MEFPSDQWIELKSRFKPIFKSLLEKVNTIVRYNEFYTKFEIDSHIKNHINATPLPSIPSNVVTQNSSQPKTKLIEFIEKEGLQSLCKNFHLKAIVHPQHNNLYHISSTVSINFLELSSKS